MSGYYSDNNGDEEEEEEEECSCEGDDEDDRKDPKIGRRRKREKIIAAKFFTKDTDAYTSSGAAFSSSGNLWFLSHHRVAKSDFEYGKYLQKKIILIFSIIKLTFSVCPPQPTISPLCPGNITICIDAGGGHFPGIGDNHHGLPPSPQ